MSLSEKLSPAVSPISIRPSQQAYLAKLWGELQAFRREVEPRITELNARFTDALRYVMEDLGVPNDGSYKFHESGTAFVRSETSGITLIKGDVPLPENGEKGVDEPSPSVS